jgi:hypothetical protein
MSQVGTSEKRKIGKLRNVELVQEATKKSMRSGRPDCVDGTLAHRSQGGQQGRRIQVLKQNLYHHEDWPPGPDGLP